MISKENIEYLVDALNNLVPNCEFVINGDAEYNNIKWLSDSNLKPSETDIDVEIVRLKNEWINSEYQRRRASEYPPITDYIDGIVKGDTVQVQEYIDKCLAIKAKYPKGE